MCPRAVLLQQGRLIVDGPTESVLGTYLSLSPEAPEPRKRLDLSRSQRSGTHEVRFQAVEYTSRDPGTAFSPYPDGPLELEIELISNQRKTVGSLGVSLHDQQGARLLSADTMTLGMVTDLEDGLNRVTLRIEALHLNPGVYYATLWAAGARGRRTFDRIEAAFAIQVVDREPAKRGQMGPTTCPFRLVPSPFEPHIASP
jgi:lipopolysaccharide transport system ATP-binding protein